MFYGGYRAFLRCRSHTVLKQNTPDADISGPILTCPEAYDTKVSSSVIFGSQSAANLTSLCVENLSFIQSQAPERFVRLMQIKYM